MECVDRLCSMRRTWSYIDLDAANLRDAGKKITHRTVSAVPQSDSSDTSASIRHFAASAKSVQSTWFTPSGVAALIPSLED